jgi:hypothetical protein
MFERTGLARHRRRPAGCHLHGGGALGADGPVSDVDLPPALAPAALVPPADRMAAVTAVLASLRLLELAPTPSPCRCWATCGAACSPPRTSACG